jgi:hypothetical protein
MANLGVPIKLLHEALGHVVTCELKTGQVSRVCVLMVVGQRADRVVRRSCIEELCSKVRSPFPFHLPLLLSAYRRTCSLTPTIPRSRRLVQHLPARDHRHRARRPRLPARAGVYPGQHGEVLYRAGYAGECADVSTRGRTGGRGDGAGEGRCTAPASP